MPVVPVKGQIWATEEAPRGTLRRVLYTFASHHRWALRGGDMRDDAAGLPCRVTHDATGARCVDHGYARQCTDGRVIFGGDRVACDGRDYSASDEATAHSRSMWAGIVPRLVRGERAPACDGAWAGIMPFSMDGKPLVGSCAAVGHPRVWMLAGFGCWRMGCTDETVI